MSLEHAPVRGAGLQVVRARELAELLGVSKSTVWSWVKSGRLEAPLELGPRVRGWLVRDLERHLRGCARTRRRDRAEAELEEEQESA